MGFGEGCKIGAGRERSVNTGDGYSLSKQGLNGGTFFPNFFHSFKFLCFLRKVQVLLKERRIQVLKNVPVNSHLLELKKEGCP